MKKTTDRMNALQNAFKKDKVLDMKALQRAIDSSAPATVHRYLKQIDYLTSYTHNGRYYTLSEIVHFDTQGFWHYGDIGFSQYGTLIDTVHHLITISQAGQTNSELERCCRIRIQEILRTLLKRKQILRTKAFGHYLYMSEDEEISKNQLTKRHKMSSKKQQEPWVVIEILIEALKSLPDVPKLGEIVGRLAKRGSSITQVQVEQVFEEENLEKKTPD
jgi:hypothetical protein